MSMAARLTQIDYDREMALVATEASGLASEILAAVHLFCDPDNERAEFVALVRGDMQGRGLGYALMTDIIDHARRRGLGEIFGDVLQENQRMLRLCRELGFAAEPKADEKDVVRVTLALRPQR